MIDDPTLIPTAKAAPLLGLSTWRVCQLARNGTLRPVGLWCQPRQNRPTFWFHLDDVTALAARRAQDIRDQAVTFGVWPCEPVYVPVYNAAAAALHLDATIRGLARQAVYARRSGTPDSLAAADAMLTLRSGLLREQMALRRWERAS